MRSSASYDMVANRFLLPGCAGIVALIVTPLTRGAALTQPERAGCHGAGQSRSITATRAAGAD